MKESSSGTHLPAPDAPRRKKYWKTLKLGDQPLRKPVKHFLHRLPSGLN